MRRLLPLAGLLVALAIPSLAQADSSTAHDICVEGYNGVNKTTGATLADFESPQKGSPSAQVNWAAVARGVDDIISGTISDSSNGTNTTYCIAHRQWDHTTGFGLGLDHYLISYFVAWNNLGGGVFRPTAYGSWYGSTYWQSSFNRAISDWSVPMYWGGGHSSNYSYPAP